MAEHEVVATTEIMREKGFLYICKGNPLSIIKVRAGRKKKVVQEEVKTETTEEIKSEPTPEPQPEVTQEIAQEVIA
mgnify:CR=1 FL=1